MCVKTCRICLACVYMCTVQVQHYSTCVAGLIIVDCSIRHIAKTQLERLVCRHSDWSNSLTLFMLWLEKSLKRIQRHPHCRTTQVLEHTILFLSFVGPHVDFIIESHDSYQTLQTVSTKPFQLSEYRQLRQQWPKAQTPKLSLISTTIYILWKTLQDFFFYKRLVTHMKSKN